ncbi:LacI family DNA-binding transcriptional regulator [Fusibacter ferrireducens]|nr:LacI family DNA-binding transcriptional regulator [Fusibacter ferrireducens]
MYFKEGFTTKVTIKDIAKHVGVSAMTVSNVINKRSSKVSADTVTKIEKAIEELGYVPDYSARSLVSKKSKMIGVIIPQTETHKQFLLENPFYSEIVSGIESKLREKNYYMMLTGVDKDSNYLDVLINWNLDAAIILGIYQEGFYEQLKKINIPVLLIDSYINDGFFYNLGIDDLYGGYIATKYLIEKGHQDIAIITGHLKKEGVAEKRFLGYKKALDEAGIPFNINYVYADSVSYECGITAGQKIIEECQAVTAVFATADLIAAGAIASFHAADIKVPDDISIIGFDNLSISKMTYPLLTTVDQKIFEKGMKAANILMDTLKSSNSKIEKSVILDIEIIERNSVKNMKSKR